MLVYALTRVWVVKQPHISAKELYISAKKPCISAKEPYLRWVVQKPYASGNALHTRKRVLYICKRALFFRKRALSFRKRVCAEQMRSVYPQTCPICVALSAMAVDVGTCVHAYMSSKRATSIRKRAQSIRKLTLFA